MTKPNTHEMVVAHRVFRRESRLLAELIAQVRPGDTTRAAVLAAHLADYRLGLHNHHTGEDENLWPPLLARVDLEADLVLRMEEQHERVATTLTKVEAALPRWASAAGEAERDELVAALWDHRAVLLEHLDDEEKELLPLAERHVSAQEWNRMAEHFQATTPKPKQLIFLGAVLEEATPDERAEILGTLPRPVRWLWHLAGSGRYTRHVRKIRSPA